MTEFSGVRTSTQTNSSNENRQVRFVSERTFLYSPQYTPILTLRGGVMPGPNGERIKVKGLIGSKFTPAKKVEWYDKELPGVTVYMTATLDAHASSVTATIDDGAGALPTAIAVGSILRGNGENLFVTALTNSGTYYTATVTRGVGATSPAQQVDNAALKLISNAVAENSTYQTRRTVKADVHSNNMQIFRHDWAVSRSADKIRLYGGKDKAETMAEAATQHVRELERAATFGFASTALTNASSEEVFTMGGLYEYNDGFYNHTTSTGRFLTAGVAHGGTMSYIEFVDTFLTESFKYSSPRRRKTFLGGSVWGKIFGRFSTDVGNIQTYVKDTAFGVAVTEVISPAGTIDYLTSGAIEDVEPGTSFCFDPEYLEFDYIDNTFMVDNAQSKGTDGYAGYFLTEHTLKAEAIKTVTGCTGVTGWVTN